MQSLTRHLHAFVREVRLTESEWDTAIAFVTEATVFGPFFTADAPLIDNGGDIAGARSEVWEADEDGFYDV
ncbi:hypothetical protein BH11ACT2_BH11ACT2_14830 [soil metagenome]